MTFDIRDTCDKSAFNLYVNGNLALSYVRKEDAEDAVTALKNEPYDTTLYSEGAHIAHVIRENVSPTRRAMARMFGV